MRIILQNENIYENLKLCPTTRQISRHGYIWRKWRKETVFRVPADVCYPPPDFFVLNRQLEKKVVAW